MNLKKKFTEVGFDLVHEKDYSITDKRNPIPFYYDFTRGCTLSGFAASWIGIWLLWFFSLILECFRIAPQGTAKGQGILQIAANSLTQGGKTGSVTIAYMLVGKKQKN